jgi:Ser/Thr protein kinase RdoA (MazF antagonist)
VEPSDWTDKFVVGWGRTLGMMHALAKVYRPLGGLRKRPLWSEEYGITAAEPLLSDQPEIYQRHRELLAYLQTLPAGIDDFGLIHSDFEDENFFVDGNRIVAFDFDECQCHWFIYDIAAVIRESTWRCPPWETDAAAYPQKFAALFLQGYAGANCLDQFWFHQIGWFLRLRELNVYVYALGKCGVGGNAAWPEAVLTRMRDRIAAGEPCFRPDSSTIM